MPSPDPAPGPRAALSRGAAIALWRERLGVGRSAPEPAAPPPPAGPPGTLEVRVRLGPGTFVLEARKGPGAPWRNAWRELRERIRLPGPAGWLGPDVGPAALVLLALLREHLGHGGPDRPQLGDPATAAWLRAVLHDPRARALVTTPSGEPLRFVDAPLRRRLVPPDSPGEAYRLVLVDPAGRPVPPGVPYLGGDPALYLLPSGLHAGPRALDGQSAAAALVETGFAEDSRMLATFRAAGVELPPALAARVLRVPLSARVDCGLLPAPAGGERLVLELTTAGPGRGLEAAWTDHGWDHEDLEERVVVDGDRVLELDAALPDLVASRLADLGLVYDRSEGRWTTRAGRNFPATFTRWRQALPLEVEVRAQGELASLLQGPVRAGIDLQLAAAGGDRDWFDLALVLRPEDATLTRAEIALLLRARGELVRLPGKGWRRLEVVLDDADAGALGAAGLDPGDAAAAAFAGEKIRLHALQVGGGPLAGRLPAALASELRARAAALTAPPAPAAPAGLRATLRPYQLEGFHFLAFLAANRLGGILADDMGLGKTVQALAWLLWLGERAPAGAPLRALVVCPKSVVGNWEAETARFAPGLATRRHEPGKEPTPPAGPGIVLANYTQLRLDAAAFAARRWDAVILDEGQFIKTPSSQVARAARALDATHRLVLTGTPVENRLLDLWSLLAFALPGLLGTATAFRREHAGATAATLTRLRARVRPFVLRRAKAQVAADLPARTEKELIVDLEDEQQRLYQAELKRARAHLLRAAPAGGLERVRFHVLASLLRLRQICCHPGLVDPALRDAPSAKLEELVAQVRELRAEGHQVLVFSQFVEMLGLIRTRLEAEAIPHLLLTGATEDRDALVRRFQEERDFTVFLLSLRAAGFGLNLTAASYVILCDPWWNPAVEAQAIDRTHRIGQTSPVIAYRLLARGTVEEKIRRLQAEKAALAGAVVQEEALSALLDLETLRALLA